jgi:predicted metal-binding transcription factor (methanogenesis marker protein 9)
MSKPMVRIHNTNTGEIIDREMTDAEFTQYKKDEANYLAYKAELQSQATAKAALLAQLGITEEQAKLLLS